MSWQDFLFTGDDGTERVSLDRLGFATGIAREHLSAYLEGTLYPPDAHIEVLADLVGPQAAAYFMGHQPNKVPSVISPWGKPPEGTEVLSYVPASSAQQGDYLSYSPVGGRGAHWVEIQSIEQERNRVGNLLLNFEGGYVVEVSQDRPLRIARLT